VSDFYYVAAPGVLGLRTNVRGFKWSWEINMPEVGRQDFEACALRVRLTVGDVPMASDPSVKLADLGKYHYFGGRPGDDSVYYERTLLGKRQLQLRLSGLLGDEPTLEVNPAYLRYLNYRFMNLHSAGYILTDATCLLLLQRGYSPLHCSSFKYKDATVLVLAAPNTGKTLTSMMACLENGADFLAEDLAITDGSTLFSVPWTSTFRYYDRVDTTRRSRVLNRMTKVIPPMELLPLAKSSGIDTLLSTDHILPSSPITHIAILERGPESVTLEDPDEAYRKAVNLNRFEFNYTKAPALVAHEFFNPQLDLDAAAAAERRILRETVTNAKELLVVRTPDATRYAPLLIEHLSRQ
jgi:hypothetical protein